MKNYYDKKYLEIFSPTWTEYLWDIISIIKNNDKFISKAETKKNTLNYITIMLKNNMVKVGNEWENKKLIYWDLSNEEILKKIDLMWFDDAEYPDFLNMVWFGYQEWYIKALKKEGYKKERILWADFVDKNIGNFEKWIEKNKTIGNIIDENN